MVATVRDFLARANEDVPKLSPSEAADRMGEANVLVLDVRDPSELIATGKLKGALNVSRGMLEFRADPDSPYYDPIFDKTKTVLVHCASGGRSALAGQTLKAMGYEHVYNIGGFKDLAAAGIDVEPV